jgi:hypothetical protein
MPYRGIEQPYKDLEQTTDESETDEESSVEPEPARRRVITDRVPKRIRRYRLPVGGALKGLTDDHTIEHKPKKAYTADASGNFGAVKVNTRQLRAGNLVVTNHQGDQLMNVEGLGERVRHQDPCIYKLVMHAGIQCLMNGKYDEDEMEASLNAFKKLVEISMLEPKRGVKFDVIYGEPVVQRVFEFIPYSSPEDLLEELELIGGSVAAGNNQNSILRKKGIAILEELLRIGSVTEKQYSDLYDKVIDGVLV